MEKPACRGLVQRGNAITTTVVVGGAVQTSTLAELDKIADEQIKPSVVVIVEPNCARAPSGRGDPGFLRHIGKGAVAVVVIENALAVLGHIQVRKAVAVIVAYRHALAVASGADPGLQGHIS